MASDFITSALAGAHKTLDAANSSSVGTKSGHSNFSDSSAAKPTHEYSNTPYSLVKSAAKKALGPTDEAVHEAGDTGKGIKSNMENAAAVKDVK